MAMLTKENSMSTSLKVEFSFPYGHRLMMHQSLCKNIHGHRAKIVLTFEGKVGEGGMIADFTTIKQSVVAKIVETFDHSLVLNCYDTELIQALKPFGFKIYIFGSETQSRSACEPTSENFAQLILDMYKYSISGTKLIRVEFFETETNSAVAEALQ